jgi:predicted transcriptional regulator
VKTTIDIDDALHARARRHARRTGRAMRALIEEGLRLVLEREAKTAPKYQLPDCSVGRPGDPNPLERWSWSELRDEIYGGR